MYNDIQKSIVTIKNLSIDNTRKEKLLPLVKFIFSRINEGKSINLNFICTHNSRRSHLAQIWAQMASSYYDISKVFCYSGGTEATSVYPKIIETLESQGFIISRLMDGDNSVYACRYDKDSMPIILFSKEYDHPFNPDSAFAAIMTCSDADQNCPMIPNCLDRFAITYEDPKIFDQSSLQSQKYKERSLEIGAEMIFVFRKVQSLISKR